MKINYNGLVCTQTTKGITQTFIVYKTEGIEIWTRNYCNGIWKNWFQILGGIK